MSKTNTVCAVPRKVNVVWISSAGLLYLESSEAENGQVLHKKNKSSVRSMSTTTKNVIMFVHLWKIFREERSVWF